MNTTRKLKKYKPTRFMEKTSRYDKEAADYAVMFIESLCHTTEGNVVHYGYIKKFIESLGERSNIREIAFDRWGAVQMVQNLEGVGFTVVSFGQGFKDMCHRQKN